MEVHIYSSVNVKSQPGNVMRQRYNDNTKIPKQKENKLGILKIYAFCQKIQQTASALLGLQIYYWEYTQKFAASFA